MHTRRAYLSDVRQLAKFAGADSTPRETTTRGVRAWLVELQKSCGPATRARKLASVRSFYRFLVREGEVSLDPSAGLPLPKTPARLPRPLSVDDCDVLVKAEPPAATPLAALRARALTELLYGTGIRVGELVSLDVRDVDLHGAEVRVLGKGNKERIVPLPRLSPLAPGLRPRGRTTMCCGPTYADPKKNETGYPHQLTSWMNSKVMHLNGPEALCLHSSMRTLLDAVDEVDIEL